MVANLKEHYTLEEYFELERNSEERYEYWNGEVFDMSGASPEHDQILINFITNFNAKFGERKCRVFSSNVRVKVPTAPPYRYPDLSVMCGEPKFEKIGGVDALINPALIIEILSSSTEAYDRGDKFTHYKSIPSFNEYLLVAQHRPHITQLVKQADGIWIHKEFNSLEDVLKLTSLDCVLALTEIYQNISFQF